MERGDFAEVEEGRVGGKGGHFSKPSSCSQALWFLCPFCTCLIELAFGKLAHGQKSSHHLVLRGLGAKNSFHILNAEWGCLGLQMGHLLRFALGLQNPKYLLSGPL